MNKFLCESHCFLAGNHTCSQSPQPTSHLNQRRKPPCCYIQTVSHSVSTLSGSREVCKCDFSASSPSSTIASFVCLVCFLFYLKDRPGWMCWHPCWGICDSLRILCTISIRTSTFMYFSNVTGKLAAFLLRFPVSCVHYASISFASNSAKAKLN